jgi:hypothetical protein
VAFGAFTVSAAWTSFLDCGKEPRDAGIQPLVAPSLPPALVIKRIALAFIPATAWLTP